MKVEPVSHPGYLSPNIIVKFFDPFVGINQDQNGTMLIVEQKVDEILRFAHRVYSIQLGKVVYDGKAGMLRGDKKRLGELFL